MKIASKLSADEPDINEQFSFVILLTLNAIDFYGRDKNYMYVACRVVYSSNKIHVSWTKQR